MGVVELAAVVGRKVDAGFRREYAEVKQRVASGRLDEFFVRVVVTEDSWPHTVAAVRQALGGVPLARGGRFAATVAVEDVGSEKVSRILAELDSLESGPVVRVKPRPVFKPAGKPRDPELAKADVVKSAPVKVGVEDGE